MHQKVESNEDDGEVQVLLTIQPPTPKRSNQDTRHEKHHQDKQELHFKRPDETEPIDQESTQVQSSCKAMACGDKTPKSLESNAVSGKHAIGPPEKITAADPSLDATPEAPPDEPRVESDEGECMTSEKENMYVGSVDKISTPQNRGQIGAENVYMRSDDSVSTLEDRSQQTANDGNKTNDNKNSKSQASADGSVDPTHQEDDLSLDVATTDNEDSQTTVESQPTPSSGPIPTGSADNRFVAPFSLLSSAYVQNLAEICFLIMTDRRWRVQGTEKPLFGWENGDDMTAISKLRRVYRLRKPTKKMPCSCILCRDKEDNPTEPQPESSSFPLAMEDDDDETDAGSIHLFCRMFYRKGPWFRIDDLFRRYYQPKQRFGYHASRNRRGRDDTAPGVSPGTSGSSAHANSPAGDAVREGEGSTPERPSEKPSNLIDEAKFAASLRAMEQMMDDMQRLVDLGLARTFQDEEECGRTAGAVSAERGGILLSADERCNVLTKLGGTKKKGSRPRGMTPVTMESNSLNSTDNLIWKQMRQQQSISVGIFKAKKGNERALLPVRNHVNHEILSKLATNVVTAASNVRYLPSHVLRTKLTEVRKALSKIAKSREKGASSSMMVALDTSFRLREAPLRSLRRCCRLFLCATVGPGNMRSDGTNGWKSLRDNAGNQRETPFARLVPPPGETTWHGITYPYLAHCFGISPSAFLHSFKHLQTETSEKDYCQTVEAQSGFRVFPTLSHFHAWELAVEIRANIDFLAECNEIINYNIRRQARRAKETKLASFPRQDKETAHLENFVAASVDFLGVLTTEKRRRLLGVFPSCGDDFSTVVNQEARFSTEHLSSHPDVQVNLSACETVLVRLASIATTVLAHRHAFITQQEVSAMVTRPWLRHLWWEAVLAYSVWDCIPVLEKRGLHAMASQSLEILVFGKFQDTAWRQGRSHGWGSVPRVQHKSIGLSQVLISRRAMGKAFDRLMIDYVHILRGANKTDTDENESMSRARTSKRKGQKETTNPQGIVNRLCDPLIMNLSANGSIPFAAIRSLARRLKKPLSVTVGEQTRESRMLHLRLGDDGTPSKSSGYIDWTPKVDQAVAASLRGEEDESIVGKRCSFIGFEDVEQENGRVSPSSLNVEQLAMEFYNTGRLPCNDPALSGGGWVGWHDEGGHLRALFRLLCAGAVLGMDGGCGSLPNDESIYSVYLTPYQGSPFDLHVGSWGLPDSTLPCVPGFLARRRTKITMFLNKLQDMSSQEVSDAVHQAVLARWKFGKEQGKPDSVLIRDITRVRTLSMLAAGFGGQQLAAAFRCMLFDYRHYSGGLPDLLLVRALYNDSDLTSNAERLVDLGEWVGESFDKKEQLEREADDRAAFLIDKDDEFLGCSKVGDSAGSSGRTWRKRQQAPANRQPTLIMPEPPQRLLLSCAGKPVSVECLFVEVKSANDRLDGRQEDWLNVLDRFGNARVCKFVKKSAPKKKKRKGEAKSAELSPTPQVPPPHPG